MLGRLIVGAGLFAVGYLLGREVGRAEPLRDELRRAREAAGDDPAVPRREARKDDVDRAGPAP